MLERQARHLIPQGTRLHMYHMDLRQPPVEHCRQHGEGIPRTGALNIMLSYELPNRTDLEDKVGCFVAKECGPHAKDGHRRSIDWCVAGDS